MIDKEQIGIMIKDIRGYFSDLKTIHLESKKDLEEPEKKHAISMIVFSIMNRTLDIANEVIGGSSIPFPASYKDTFEVLKSAKVITPNIAEKMVWLAKYRNIIAHEYYRLGPDELYELKKKIYNVEQFIEEIKRFVK